MIKTISKIGNSQGIIFDSALLQLARLKVGDVTDLAAAYLFYLCCNHPFVDGNKRVALGSGLVFLRLNGLSPAPDGEEWENLTLAVAAGALSRDEVTATLRKLVTGRNPADSSGRQNG